MKGDLSVHIEQVARFTAGDPTVEETKVQRSMKLLGLCLESQALLRLAHVLLKEGIDMPVDPGLLTELVKLIKDVVEKSRRDRLIELVNDLFSKYTFVLRTWTRMEDRHKNCAEMDDEVNRHLQDAKRAAKAGNADALQEALAKAEDDLEHLAKCLGIEIMPS